MFLQAVTLLVYLHLQICANPSWLSTLWPHQALVYTSYTWQQLEVDTVAVSPLSFLFLLPSSSSLRFCVWAFPCESRASILEEMLVSVYVHACTDRPLFSMFLNMSASSTAPWNHEILLCHCFWWLLSVSIHALHMHNDCNIGIQSLALTLALARPGRLWTYICTYWQLYKVVTKRECILHQ